MRKSAKQGTNGVEFLAWCQKEAEQGNVNAQTFLSCIYYQYARNVGGILI